MSKNILIIGTGFVGSRLFLSLVSRYNVQSLDIGWFDSGVNPNGKKIDYNDLTGAFFRQFDVIILTAGHSSVKLCLQNPQGAFLNNVRNFKNLLHKLTSVQRLIYFSSSSVYGSIAKFDATEGDICFQSTNEYDLNKYEIDQHALLSDIEFYGLRPGTICGWSPECRVDIMVNSMMASARENGRIDVFNRGVMRPILGLSDLCAAVDQIIKSPLNLRGLYNLASFNSSVEDIAIRVGKYINVPVFYGGEQKQVSENTKLESRTYNFSIDTTKFRAYFKNFEFKDTAESICHELNGNWANMKFSKRIAQINYE